MERVQLLVLTTELANHFSLECRRLLRLLLCHLRQALRGVEVPRLAVVAKFRRASTGGCQLVSNVAARSRGGLVLRFGVCQLLPHVSELALARLIRRVAGTDVTRETSGGHGCI